MNEATRAKIENLNQQVEHARAKLADESCSAEDRHFFQSTIVTVEELIRKELSKHRLNRVHEIAPGSSNQELTKARMSSAVKRGDDVYLPLLKEVDSVMPNCFLRSALFGAGDGGEKVDRMKIESQGGVSLELTGLTLSTADKRVYAALLSYYKNRPLGIDSIYAEDFLPLKLSALAMTAFGAKNSQLVANVRESLHRLKVAYLSVRIPGVIELDLPSLIEVRGTEDKGVNSRVSFRISSKVATLFGQHRWTSLSPESLELAGLASWLATFYASHSKPRELHVLKDLKRLSGSQSSNSEFKRMLPKRLEKLKGLAEENPARVRSVVFNGNAAVVEMAAWSAN